MKIDTLEHVKLDIVCMNEVALYWKNEDCRCIWIEFCIDNEDDDQDCCEHKLDDSWLDKFDGRILSKLFEKYLM